MKEKSDTNTKTAAVVPEPKKTMGDAGKAVAAVPGADLMYLGPTIQGVARHGTVFRGGILPAKAQECIRELPQMSRLFVEIDKTPGAVMELRKKQSVLGAVYAQAEEKFRRV